MASGSDMDSAPQPRAGLALEQRVGALYRALGFDVRRDVRRAGKQIDVLVERVVPGFGSVRMVVEAKDHPGRVVPIDEVREFVTVSSLLISSGACDRAVMVTTGSYTPAAWEAAEAVPYAIELLTFADLERQLLVSDGTIARWLVTYRAKPINQTFIDLRATLFDLDGEGDTQFPGRTSAAHLLDLAIANPGGAVFVLGDYGAGKTTLLERLKATAIERYQIDPNAQVPVLIPLKLFRDGLDVQTLLAAVLPTELGISVPPEVVWDLHAMGRYIFLLDGFDEITLRADRDRRGDLLGLLSPLLFGPSPALLTSRPSYFADLDEYRDALTLMRGGGRMRAGTHTNDPGRDRLAAVTELITARYLDSGPTAPVVSGSVTYRLDPLTSEQIDEYLQSRSAELAAVGVQEPSDVRSFLDSIYDLSDLIKRPIILDMAVATVLLGQIDVRNRTLANGPAGLYEIYTNSKLETDFQKSPSRREFLTFNERVAFAINCATAMAKSDRLWVTAEELAALAKRSISTTDGTSLDEALTDLRTCSFLTIDGEGSLQFIHRSFQEYFFAQHLRSSVLSGRTRELTQALRWEYLYFLGAFGFTNNDFYNRLFELARSGGSPDTGDNTVANNAAVALLAARESASGLEWHRRHIRSVRRPKISLLRSQLVDVKFEGLEIGTLDVSDSYLRSSIDSSDIRSLRLSNCTGEIRLSGSIGMVEVDGEKMTIADHSTANLQLQDGEFNVEAQKDRPYRLVGERTSARIWSTGVDLTLTDSTVSLSGPGPFLGSCTRTRVDVPGEHFDNLGATLDDSLLVINSARRPPDGRGVHARSKSGHDTVLLAHPDVTLDAYWSNQGALLSIGGHVPAQRTRWPSFIGVTSAARPLPDGDFVRARVHERNGIVIEGAGRSWEAGHAEYRDILRLSPRTSAEGQDFVARLSRFLERCNAPMELAQSILTELSRRLEPFCS